MTESVGAEAQLNPVYSFSLAKTQEVLPARLIQQMERSLASLKQLRTRSMIRSLRRSQPRLWRTVPQLTWHPSSSRRPLVLVPTMSCEILPFHALIKSVIPWSFRFRSVALKVCCISATLCHSSRIDDQMILCVRATGKLTRTLSFRPDTNAFGS